MKCKNCVQEYVLKFSGTHFFNSLKNDHTNSSLKWKWQIMQTKEPLAVKKISKTMEEFWEDFESKNCQYRPILDGKRCSSNYLNFGYFHEIFRNYKQKNIGSKFWHKPRDIKMTQRPEFPLLLNHRFFLSRANKNSF